jgi:ketosteroid isomerase-like protein
MYIKPNRTHSYLGTFVTSDKGDMDKLRALRESVSMMNKTDAFWGTYPDYLKRKKRVVARGRNAIVKMKVPGSKGRVSYERGGNVVGGIKNAGEFDVYIYDRHPDVVYP